MLYFFYFTRNIIGLIMVISPASGLLFIDYNSDLFILFLSGILLGIPLGLYCMKFLPFRLWTNLTAVCFLLSALKPGLSQNPSGWWISLIFMGLCTPSLTALLPVNIITGWFRSSKVQILGLVWTVSLTSGFLLRTIMERFTYLSLATGAVMMLTGTVFLLQSPPHFVIQSSAPIADILRSSHQQRSTSRIFIFFSCICFTAGLAFFLPDERIIIDFFLSEKALIIAGLCAGPAIAALFAGFKGIYSSCIWILFLAEITMACSGQASGLVAAGYACSLSAGLCLGGLPVVIPVMTYYVCGPLRYNDCLCRILASAPAGLLLSMAAAYMLSDRPHLPWIYAGAIFLLTFAFFAIFSAWKNRLFLLKSAKI